MLIEIAKMQYVAVLFKITNLVSGITENTLSLKIPFFNFS